MSGTNISEPCGILCLDKPAGVSSHDMVGKIRKLYGTRKVGHAGTLDPMATGLLVILIGRVTKLSDFLLTGDKAYAAMLQLGIVTDTQDVTGEIVERICALPSPERVAEVCRSFLGPQTQIPPMYSAKKIDGQKLYDLARRGEEVERKACEIVIRELELSAVNADMGIYNLDVVCSKGTYIRTLCHDIGQRLGCGGAMAALRRRRSGTFSIEDAHTVEELEALSMPERIALLKSADQALSDLPKVILPAFYANLASHGCEIYQKKIGTTYAIGQLVRMYGGDGLFALGKVGDYPDGTAIKPIRQL